MVTEPIVHPDAAIQPGEAMRPMPARRAVQAGDLLSRSWAQMLLLLGADVAGVAAARALAGILTRRSMNAFLPTLGPVDDFLFCVPLVIALLYLFGGYKRLDLRRPEKELELLTKSVSVSFAALAGVSLALFQTLEPLPSLITRWYLLTLVSLLLARFSLRAMYGALWRRGVARRKGLVIGTAARLADFQQRLSIQRYPGYEMTGILLEPAEPTGSRGARSGLPLLGPREDWEEIMDTEGIQLVVVPLEESAADHFPEIVKILRRCRERGIDFESSSRLFDKAGLRCERDEFTGGMRLFLPPRWSRTAQRMAKVLLDILAGLVGSIITIGLFPVIGLLIKWEDGGAILYRREYVGTDGRMRHFLKFRTMVEDADQLLENNPALKARFESSLKLKDDPRVLRVGRFLRRYSLDEFPQFFGVLTGQLSFIGPRAITREARDRYGELLPKLLSMKPGLTGFWQVMGRQTTTYEEKIQMDMFYIDHWSIWLDFVIIAKTLREVARGQGAF
jgi:exopolysaccharide biosynthesis polyprenyl glycosylphosphotransferase